VVATARGSRSEAIGHLRLVDQHVEDEERQDSQAEGLCQTMPSAPLRKPSAIVPWSTFRSRELIESRMLWIALAHPRWRLGLDLGERVGYWPAMNGRI
jgi:hypothetical protein